MSGYNVMIPSVCRDRAPEVTLPLMDALQELGHTPVVLDMQSIASMYQQIRYASHGCYEIFSFYVKDLIKKQQIDFAISVGLAAIMEDETRHEAHHLPEECGIPNMIYLTGRDASCLAKLQQVGASGWGNTFIACGTQSLRDALAEQGISNSIHMPPGTNLRLFYPRMRPPANAAFPVRMDDEWLTADYDVSFVGSYDMLREQYLCALLDAGVRLAIWGDQGWAQSARLRPCYRREARYLVDVNTIYNASKINLDLPHAMSTYPDYVSQRVLDCLASQNFLATWRRPGLQGIVEVDHEVATFGDERELVQLVPYYLEQELEAHRIATRANGRVKEQCSWRQRLEHALPQLEMRLLTTSV